MVKINKYNRYGKSSSYNWRASEASETLIGLNNGNRRYQRVR